MPEEEEREKLAKVITQWNNNRLDLFEISQPDENLEFHGVIRFYFEDHAGGNMATTCLRVCSNSSAHELIQTLSEKFRPDVQMLTSYSLYEIHTNKGRKLDMDERPLVVQLNWNSDNREGCFVLMKNKQNFQENWHEKEKGGLIQTFKSRLLKKEKKNKTKVVDRVSEDEQRSTEKPLNSVCDHETKEGCTQKKQQSQASLDQPGLPVGIMFCDNLEEAFLSAVINYASSSTLHFKLSPAYALYAAGRFALQRHYKRSPPPLGHPHSVALITNKMVAMTGKVIQRQQTMAGALSFWMANSAELLNFFKHDKDLSPLTQQSQLDLSHLVHKSYSHLLQCLQNELLKHLPKFLTDPGQQGPLPAGIEMVLNTLMNTMSLLRHCRVNPALTIQLFSQLFHFISAWLFNQLISPEANTPGLRSHYWGATLRQKLTAIEAWAERQGLELAADCHLGHIIQATALLTMNKYSMHHAKDIQKTCFKLNSMQLQTLLSTYLYAATEPCIPHVSTFRLFFSHQASVVLLVSSATSKTGATVLLLPQDDLIDAVVTAAEASADNLIRSEGRGIQIEESLDLHLPFLLPKEGYSCDTVRGIPPGFKEFLEPIFQKGLCSLTYQLNSKGDWTVYFSEPTPSAESSYLAAHREPEMVTITLNKPVNNRMGVSIVAAKGAGQGNLGIYIKSIVKGGPAEMTGRLTVGDQLLSVDGQSLIGLSQERAAAIMMQTGPDVTLRVAKFAASYHGLGALLREPAPDGNTGDIHDAKSNSKALMLYSAVDPGPSEKLHESSQKKKDQIKQRNRQFYHSNPNMTTDVSLVDGGEPADPAVRGNNVAAVSSINLCTDTFHREYLTLPTPESQDKNISSSSQPQETSRQRSSKMTFMHQALSQESFCLDSGCPLLDKRQKMWEQQDWSAKQIMTAYPSFPFHSSTSTHNILSDNNSHTNRQQWSRTSGTGVSKTPFSHHPTPTPSIQPIRINIPVTRAMKTQLKAPLTTFQSSSLLAVKMSQPLRVNGHNQSPQNQDNCIHACHVSSTEKPPQPLFSSQQQTPSTCRGQAAKSQASITPTKHASFQEPYSQQKKGTGPRKQKDPQELPDPWRRGAQEKQQRLREMELLEQEVQELPAKAKHSSEENDRLRKLHLEWQFQKRLHEIQRSGEDEEEDEDFNMMVMIQQLETRAQVKHMSNKSSGGNVNSEPKEVEQQEVTCLSETENRAETDHRSSGLTRAVHNMASKE
uniref:afadin n=1 Tax=Monopterus albus TaxID=43700 RepID=UPI0009B3398C|nr:afadin-like [Monopterus albus]